MKLCGIQFIVNANNKSVVEMMEMTETTVMD